MQKECTLDDRDVDETKGLDVEIIDLAPIEESNAFARLRGATYRLLTRIRWQRFRFVVLPVLLLCVVLLASVMVDVAHGIAPKSITAQECVRQQPKIVFVAAETVTSSGTTITVIAVPAPSVNNSHLPSSAVHITASTTCN